MRRTTILLVTLVIVLVWGLTVARSQTVPTCRDSKVWPFAQNSIWNIPIGSGASYVDAKFVLPQNGYGAEENVIIMTPEAPLRTLMAMSGGGWDGGSQQPRCDSSGQAMYGGNQFPVPNDFVTLNRLSGGTPNASAAILDRDGKTIYQNQPFTICSAGGTMLSKYPYQEDNILTGDGIKGAQGGSGMSSLGGAIRVNEMVSGGVIRHALKLVVFGEENLHFDTGSDIGYRWPAWKHDSGAKPGSCPGGSNQYCGTNAALKMGALLALSPSVDINSLGLQTESARMIARALQDYGGYVVDNSAWSHVGIAVEFGPAGEGNAKMNSLGGFNKSDLDKIFSRLSVVNNNTSSSIGGGGTPRVALAPPFCAAAAEPTNPPETCAKKSQGDADCNGMVSLVDYQIWRTEFQNTQNTKRADFNADTKVSLVDYQIWRATFLKGATPTIPPSGTACIGGPNVTIKIMPLGDSITAGTWQMGYRGLLQDKLKAVNVKFDFVGNWGQDKPQDWVDWTGNGFEGIWYGRDTSDVQSAASLPHYDPDYEGHGGFQAGQPRLVVGYSDHMLAQMVPWDIPKYQPDVILMHIGWNDAGGGWSHHGSWSGADVSKNVIDLIDKIIQLSPNTWILVSPNRTGNDPAIQEAVNLRILQNKKLKWVGAMFSQFGSGDMMDGAHPNESGYRKMADQWFAVLNPMICK